LTSLLIELIDPYVGFRWTDADEITVKNDVAGNVADACSFPVVWVGGNFAHVIDFAHHHQPKPTPQTPFEGCNTL
jgi:hypothetical protein